MKQPEHLRVATDSGVVAPAGRELSCQQVVDTTELRWFGSGELPADVEVWFGRDGRAGVIEERSDTYAVGRRTDVGIKFRSQRRLELKSLTSRPIPFSVGDGFHGQLETWRKWSPAALLPMSHDRVQWIDVHKTIEKRRFTIAGDEVLDPDLGSFPQAGGVDVETVALSVADRTSWSFAFAAFGPPEQRNDAIRRCWRTLTRTSPPESFNSETLRSCGYPEYLVASLAEPASSITAGALAS